MYPAGLPLTATMATLPRNALDDQSLSATGNLKQTQQEKIKFAKCIHGCFVLPACHFARYQIKPMNSFSLHQILHPT